MIENLKYLYRFALLFWNRLSLKMFLLIFHMLLQCLKLVYQFNWELLWVCLVWNLLAHENYLIFRWNWHKYCRLFIFWYHCRLCTSRDGRFWKYSRCRICLKTLCKKFESFSLWLIFYIVSIRKLSLWFVVEIYFILRLFSFLFLVPSFSKIKTFSFYLNAFSWEQFFQFFFQHNIYLYKQWS